MGDNPQACEEAIWLGYAGILLERGQRAEINSPFTELRRFTLGKV